MKIYGLIGYPLTHSFSSAYFLQKFLSEEIIDCEYLNFPISTIDELPEILIKFPEIKGLNITIPYKEKVMSFLNEIDDTAFKIGAVNTIRIKKNHITGENKLTGFNTDVDGFLASLQEIITPDIKNALVLGTGGAAKAVLYVLEKLEINSLIVSRKYGYNQITYQDLDEEIMHRCRLIINTTPLGTFPDTERAPEIPYRYITEDHILHDLIYNPTETLFMKKGKLHGARVKNGYQMLVEQAERSWKIWNEL